MLDVGIRALMEHVRERDPTFDHLRPEQILVVAGEARRNSHASIKPLAFSGGRSANGEGQLKPEVWVNGVLMLYCITLRPLFFRSSTPEARVGTLLHELFHIAPAFDGTLDPDRRHAVLGPRFAQLFGPLLERTLADLPTELLAPFAHHGEVSVLHWLERPGAVLKAGSRPQRRVYDTAQLYRSEVFQMTGKGYLSVAPTPIAQRRLH